MRILVIGSGGREHALVWKLAQSQLVKKIFAASGNPGIGELAECIPLEPKDTVALAHFAMTARIDLVVVGPEAPLVHGMVDYFQEKGIPIFGPTRAAARLEGSKVFAKEWMRRTGVPTADFHLFQDFQEAKDHIMRAPLPVVVKADGLAAGKGVVVAETREEAVGALTRFMHDRIFGESGSRVVVEEYLEGEELSVLGLVDGKHVVLLEPAQDHKRAFEGDRGPNTGGMGAYSPVPMLGEAWKGEVERRIFEPIVHAMAEAGCPFRGVLYAGLMWTEEGPKVLEYNVRFGDPEAQVLLPRLKTDLVELILACLEGRLDRVDLAWDTRACACVVLASKGYPTQYDIGREITGLRAADDLPNSLIFHAGTKKEGEKIYTAGGRVLNVVGLGDSLKEALDCAYRLAEIIQFDGKQYRRDIGAKAVQGTLGFRSQVP